MDSKTIQKAKEIVEKYNYQNLIDNLLDFWSQNPPTLGHGFIHAITVAVKAYEFGIENNYENPENLFIGGLFHDIYRPAEGSDGEEDQRKGAELTRNIFKKLSISQEIEDKVIGAINSHDDWRGTENVPQFDLILSVADKAALSTLVTSSYAWASNKTLVTNGGKPKYTSHFVTLYGFIKYQTRAWEIFAKHPIIGTEIAIESYIKINQETMDEYLKDPKGDRYLDYLDTMTGKYRDLEIQAINAFSDDNEVLKKVMALAY